MSSIAPAIEPGSTDAEATKYLIVGIGAELQFCLYHTMYMYV